ncbi:2-succinyl-6-hydroxy-2,4-cyclohexadiene-1-carboxylate synthase [Actinobacillus succinogenes]|uniref:Putative 2-succinyl-6-hydroxy-2,4-cyclohexadiene-1-carboxylate synthase n=1 Tax=Actinobacillus succinogenes (strain ATCC 55618 / DSM 22257 / CCUG 43843 / 130Z) TaxID=339671 RepID=A6VM28_ACTSZ|nr:2-succinyl-6-hydroxy-2,4-cyclohexadiene-1-carboxylate synthase [Actinobacillus succinogenes]ABR74025.1 alpha/beta hydrolase fold [Actinobacillus succinogenes 130Z]PHI39538.1 2-succinyl-6-hydroxy-2,4-cyclohexadiene-1-carboxylate synthase [Actinobacillus succinogenes]
MNFVFLHGLLGTKNDWQAVIDKLPDRRCLALDLPFHGEAKYVSVPGFEETCEYLSQQIRSAVRNKPFLLVGYSLGGRIALYYALRYQGLKGNLQGVILEGANLGLADQREKTARWLNDNKWADRFRSEPAETVLNDWYRQPVFAHLNEQERATLIRKRAPNCGENIANMLIATSLARQPYFGQKVRSKNLPFFYFVGERDTKFRQMAALHQLNTRLIAQAGHNAHLENPAEFAMQLYDIRNLSKKS